MSEIKLTKNELRAQQLRLTQLRKYLPTLQLKKAMLQVEVDEAKLQIAELIRRFEETFQHVQGYSVLFVEKSAVDLSSVVQVKKIHKDYENIAGVEIPIYRGVDFERISYSLFETSPWVDAAIEGLKHMYESQANVLVGKEKKRALEKELREVSIRVNLFEKILIPRAIKNIKKIKVFLGDQELAAVSQAKVAKTKIMANKVKSEEDLMYAH